MKARAPMSTETSKGKSPYYRPIGNEAEVFKAARSAELPVLLQGPTGCGKSRFVENMAAVADVPLIQVACNEDTSASDLLGRYLIKGGDTVWQDGPVTRAVRAGAMLYLDEVAEAREDVVVLLHSLADHRREVFIDRTNETLKAPKTFQLVASYNPGYQRGLKALKPSTRQRFVGISFTYPPAELETEIIQAESGAATDICVKLVGLARKIRSLKEMDLPETASTRLLINAAKLIAGGLPPRAACTSAIADPLTDQREELAALRDLISMSF